MFFYFFMFFFLFFMFFLFFYASLTNKPQARNFFRRFIPLIKILFSVAYYLLMLNLTIEIWRRSTRKRDRERQTRRLPSARLHNELS